MIIIKKANNRPAEKLLESDMEDLIERFPEKFLGESGLKVVARQFSIGSYRFDLLLEDRHEGKLIVEIQKGTLDRTHTYKILDYYHEYKSMRPEEFIDLMVVANSIPVERKQRLRDAGISFREIPLSDFLAELQVIEQTADACQDEPKHDILHNSSNDNKGCVPSVDGTASVYLLNTDSKSLGEVSPHVLWIQTEHAYTAGDYTKYGERILGKLREGDIVLAYANKVGVVAFGLVKDRWDGQRYPENQVVYTKPYTDVEYKIPVQWVCSLVERPIPPQPFIDTCLARPANSAFIRITRVAELVSFAQKYCQGVVSILLDSLTNIKGNA